MRGHRQINRGLVPRGASGGDRLTAWIGLDWIKPLPCHVMSCPCPCFVTLSVIITSHHFISLSLSDSCRIVSALFRSGWLSFRTSWLSHTTPHPHPHQTTRCAHHTTPHHNTTTYTQTHNKAGRQGPCRAATQRDEDQVK